MINIQEIVVKLSYFGFTRTCGEVVVSECHVIPSPVNLIGCPWVCGNCQSCGEVVGHPSVEWLCSSSGGFVSGVEVGEEEIFLAPIV